MMADKPGTPTIIGDGFEFEQLTMRTANAIKISSRKFIVEEIRFLPLPETKFSREMAKEISNCKMKNKIKTVLKKINEIAISGPR